MEDSLLRALEAEDDLTREKRSDSKERTAILEEIKANIIKASFIVHFHIHPTDN